MGDMNLVDYSDDCLEPNENCYNSGIYTDSCCCDLCYHKDECSGYEVDDEDE